MEVKKITQDIEKTTYADMEMFSKLNESEKGFIMGAIWTLLSQKKEEKKVN